MYGIVTDNLVIFGSRKRVYLIIGGLVQFITLQAVFWSKFQSVSLFSIMIFLMNISSASMDVIADSIMVIQSRHDKLKGSEKLQSFCWIVRGFGGITGALIAAYMT